MTRVLVADDERNVRLSLVYTLEDAGYDAIEAEDGSAALELALHERPDVILLDVWMPAIDGFGVLKRLKENPATQSIAVVLVTGMSPEEGEQIAMNLGVTHYISKPWEPGTVEAAVKLSLRERGATPGHQTDDAELEEPRSNQAVKTGNSRIDQLLAGGIAFGSLTLVEGMPSAGKSVLCQNFVFESLLDGHEVVYFSTQHNPKGLMDQMGALGQDVSNYLRSGQLNVYPIEEPEPGRDFDSQNDPERLMATLIETMEQLSTRARVVVVDDATNLVGLSPDASTIGFFSRCKRLCETRKVVIPVVRSYAFDDKVLRRVIGLCDVHLSLRVEKLGAKMVNMFEVRKLENAELTTGNNLAFEVVSGIGIQIVPGSRVRV